MKKGLTIVDGIGLCLLNCALNTLSLALFIFSGGMVIFLIACLVAMFNAQLCLDSINHEKA